MPYSTDWAMSQCSDWASDGDRLHYRSWCLRRQRSVVSRAAHLHSSARKHPLRPHFLSCCPAPAVQTMAALAKRPIDTATLEAALQAVQEDVQISANAPGGLLAACAGFLQLAAALRGVISGVCGTLPHTSSCCISPPPPLHPHPPTSLQAAWSSFGARWPPPSCSRACCGPARSWNAMLLPLPRPSQTATALVGAGGWCLSRRGWVGGCEGHVATHGTASLHSCFYPHAHHSCGDSAVQAAAHPRPASSLLTLLPCPMHSRCAAVQPYERPPTHGLQYYSAVPGEDIVGQPVRHMAADQQASGPLSGIVPYSSAARWSVHGGRADVGRPVGHKPAGQKASSC